MEKRVPLNCFVAPQIKATINRLRGKERSQGVFVDEAVTVYEASLGPPCTIRCSTMFRRHAQNPSTMVGQRTASVVTVGSALRDRAGRRFVERVGMVDTTTNRPNARNATRDWPSKEKSVSLQTELTARVVACVQATVGRVNEHDQRSAIGMAGTFARTHKPVPVAVNSQELRAKRDALAVELAKILENHDEEQCVIALRAARDMIDAPYRQERFVGSKGAGVLNKPGPKKKKE